MPNQTYDRPLTVFEQKALLDYVPSKICNIIREKCVKALELDPPYVAAGGHSDYYNAMMLLASAIRQELGAGDAGDDPNAAPMTMSLSADSPGTDAVIASMQERLDKQEEELIAQDELISELQAVRTFASLNLPATRAECENKYTKTQLLDILYPSA